MQFRFLKKFFTLESASGIILLFATLLSLIWTNSPLAKFHNQFYQASHVLINDGLMALFFLLVSLELKREFLVGEMQKISYIALPLISALGGMIVPALIYLSFNHSFALTKNAWAIPVATDIAFALGVLYLFGKRIPLALKLFLMNLAIFDDLGAILLIAIFYAKGLSWIFLTTAAAVMALLWFCNKQDVRSLWIYLLLGVCLWLSIFFSGIHPTVAGVFLAAAVPISHAPESTLHRLEKMLHPWVAYGIMPLFALLNAGFTFEEISITAWTDPLVLGVLLGLFIGKPLGVFLPAAALIKFKFFSLPAKSSWQQFLGVSTLCGIGFTMSLFLGTLSFPGQEELFTKVKLGVLSGSFLSAITGILLLIMTLWTKKKEAID